MALLELKDIGKIYVSEGNVNVGIRGVNLRFERGEFVAVTGKSGSGKSTLLNVISGMDSYEEGELYIEGQSTSHYLQPEWEEYREKYISFIFQDYNIIESFTVLQNVELSLMHIEDKKERREKAKELLARVGLSSHLNHKGSKLSGGQKQRTVIARALAKDSAIILADEPTGNLDSESSKEIIDLLYELSKDKLLIVVTHNFEQLEHVATRHIRIFDGAVESDHIIKRNEASEQNAIKAEEKRESKAEKPYARDIKNGFVLGRAIFFAKPRLSVFLCLLMIIGTLGIFMVTTLCGQAGLLFEPNYMFNNIKGRVVVANRDGTPISEETLETMVSKYSAESYLHYDALLDNVNAIGADVPRGDGFHEYLRCNYIYGKDYGDDIIGRYPESANEVFLYLPISWQPLFGKDELKVDYIIMHINSFRLNVTGVKYYYDNNKKAECLLTEDGFRTLNALYYFRNNVNFNVKLEKTDGFYIKEFTIEHIVPSFELPDDKIYINSSNYQYELNRYGGSDKTLTSVFFTCVYNRNYYYYESSNNQTVTFSRDFDDSEISHTTPPDISSAHYYNDIVLVSDELMRDIAESVLKDSYKQASLFFENNREAHKAAEMLQADGYVAVSADSTYQNGALDAITNVMLGFFAASVWFLAIMFLAFFINLCSSRALGAFKSDMAIMRSMGICVRSIRIGMYFRMMLSLIPAFILMVVSAIAIFTSPILNQYFVYLYAWQYALIVLGMIILVIRTTRRQIRKLFSESVKKSLKGGNAE